MPIFSSKLSVAGRANLAQFYCLCLLCAFFHFHGLMRQPHIDRSCAVFPRLHWYVIILQRGFEGFFGPFRLVPLRARMHALHPCFLRDICVWNLVLPLGFNRFLSPSLSTNDQIFLHDVGLLSRSHMNVGGLITA